MNPDKVLNKTLREIKDLLAGFKGGLSKEQFAEVLAIVSSNLEKPKGDKPVAGVDFELPKDGKTPVKGEDYWTAEDERVLIEKLTDLIHTPKKGEDYYTPAEKQEVIDSAITKVQEGIHVPKRGEDYMHDEDWVRITAKIQELVKALSPTNAEKFIVGVGTHTITVSDKEPENPQEGDIWLDSKNA